jgi:Flp pilus assembly protein TadD
MVWLAGFVLVLAAGWGAYKTFGRAGWHQWRQRQALTQVETFAERDDYRNAMLALRRATEIDQNDPRVWREAAAFLTRIGSPESVVARQNLARLEPGDTGLRVALVTEALRFGDLDAARGGLGELEEAGRRDSAFHRLAAAVALAMGRTAEFEAHLADLIAADPADASARFNLAAIRLWSADTAASSGALRELDELLREPALRVRAGLERLKFVAASRDPARADAEVAVLRAVFRPDLAGRAPTADLPGEPPGWRDLLDGLEQAAAGNANDAALFARWLSDVDLGPRALAWIDGLPEALRTAREVAGAATDLAARLNDLPRLRRQLESGAWGRVPAETIDLLLAARVQRQRFGAQRARAAWEDAVATAVDSLPGLRALARLAGLWGDRDGADRALQTIVDRYPREYWACEALRVSYSAQRDMDKLWRLYQKWAPRAPDNPAVQQTWVMLGALLNRSDPAQLARVERLLASEGDAPHTATLLAGAGALWRAGRAEEASALIDRLPEDGKKDPRAALWTAILAAERDDVTVLRATLDGLPRDRLMREEQLLLGSAISSHERRKRAAERAAQARAEAEAAAGAVDASPAPEPPIPSAGGEATPVRP